MDIKIEHRRLFLHALRTSLIFLAGFLTYELLKALEGRWSKLQPNNEYNHSFYRKLYHFILIFVFDLLILYLIAILFGVII
jgi:hypothetical protein